MSVCRALARAKGSMPSGQPSADGVKFKPNNHDLIWQGKGHNAAPANVGGAA